MTASILSGRTVVLLIVMLAFGCSSTIGTGNASDPWRQSTCFGTPAIPLSLPDMGPKNVIALLERSAFVGERSGKVSLLRVNEVDGVMKLAYSQLPLRRPRQIQAIEASRQGNLLAVADVNGGVEVIDFTRFPQSSDWKVGEWRLDHGPVLAMAWDTGGRYLYCGGVGHLYVVDVQDKSAIPKVLDLRERAVSCIAVDTENELLAVGHAGTQDVTIWNLPGLTLRWTLGGHEGFVYSVRMFPKGRLLTIDTMGVVREWDLTTGLSSEVIHTHVRRPRVQWSSDGRFLALGDSKTVSLWQYPPLRRIAQLRIVERDGEKLVGLAMDGNATFCIGVLEQDSRDDGTFVLVPIHKE